MQVGPGLGGGQLGEAQPAEVILERPVGVDARLDAQLGGAVAMASLMRRDEVRPIVFVGIRRALALTETTEGAADRADVRNVDVPVDDERDELSGELGAELVGRVTQLLDDRGPGLGEHGRQLRSFSARPSRPLAIALETDPRRWPAPRAGRWPGAG